MPKSQKPTQEKLTEGHAKFGEWFLGKTQEFFERTKGKVMLGWEFGEGSLFEIRVRFITMRDMSKGTWKMFNIYSLDVAEKLEQHIENFLSRWEAGEEKIKRQKERYED